MIKDHLRDYATEAFRFYASRGRPSYEEEMQRLKDIIFEQRKQELIRGGVSNPTAAALEHAEREMDRRSGELLDILAVDETMGLLEFGGRRSILDCVEGVYMLDPDQPLERGDIEQRVAKVEMEKHMSRRTVYRNLRNARELFAATRGLRLEKIQKKQKDGTHATN